MLIALDLGFDIDGTNFRNETPLHIMVIIYHKFLFSLFDFMIFEESDAYCIFM